MSKEIERKFLINPTEWRNLVKPAGKYLKQGYILAQPEKTIRVRVADHSAWLTIKGISVGATRAEYEYEIPLDEANELLEDFTDSLIEKIRFEIVYGNKLWEVDVFKGENEGLIVAEIELLSEDERFKLPIWIAEEVTSDKRYFNSNLTQHPFKKW